MIPYSCAHAGNKRQLSILNAAKDLVKAGVVGVNKWDWVGHDFSRAAKLVDLSTRFSA
jgi:hypothetical protein